MLTGKRHPNPLMDECFHLLEIIQNAPPFANAFIDSSQHSDDVIYININAVQLHEDCVQYPFNFIKNGVISKDQHILERHSGVSNGYHYNFNLLNPSENKNDDTNYRFTFFGELLHEFYPGFLPNLFRTKAFTPTANHPKLSNIQQRLVNLLPSEMHSPRPANTNDELEICLDNTLYEHPIFKKQEASRTYELLVDGNFHTIDWNVLNPDSSKEINEAKLFLDQIKKTYSCLLVNNPYQVEVVEWFINDIINYRKNIKIQQEAHPLEFNGITYHSFILSFYDIDLNFNIRSTNINYSRQVAVVLAYVYLLITGFRPKCYYND